MESSTVLAFRIFVMLSCLIIVPMAAIFGSAFPDVVKTVLVDRIVAIATGKTPEPAPAAAPASATAAVEPGHEAPRWSGHGAEAPQWSGNGQVVPAGSPSAYANGSAQSASFSEPAPSAPPSNPFVVEARAQQQSYAAPARGDATPGAVVQAGGSGWQQPEDFASMERKLREYGAVYYLLETWGTNGELYRFHCRMSIANNSSYTRHFEATDHDALKAMSQVLSRVEAWRSGRLQ